jgi:proteic killer suppression protein
MIRSFKDQGTADVFNGVNSRAAGKVCPANLMKVARRKLDMLNAARVLTDLKEPPRNKLEKLEENRKGQHAIRINDQYRVCFIWTDAGPEQVEITDYH